MGGIAGIFHFGTRKPVDPVRVERMCDAIAHRGPDGHGVWTEPGIGLGHRRLSIVDLTGSPQPMTSSDGRAVLVFDGEIYNFRELREELAAAGAQFHTMGDGEVILAAWQRWGTECLSRLQGMFAFALYDLGQKTLFLARDRLGVKPLFYAALGDGSLIFGSELKALTAHPRLRREADPLAVEDYLTWGYVPDARSILKGVEKLAAGHWLLLRHDAPMPSPARWWDVSFADRRKGSDADLEAELLYLLNEAVRSRMVADVPMGALLSGGMDSSSVVALMAQASAGPIKTCTIGFNAVGGDETGHAERIARLFGTDHSRRIIPDDVEAIDQLAWMFDEPFADASAMATWRLCQFAGETVKVALSGDGADEVLAGYGRHHLHYRDDRMRGLLPQSFRAPLFGALGAIYPNALQGKSTLQSIAASSAEGYARSLSVLRPEHREALYSPDFIRARGGHRAEHVYVDVMQRGPARSGLDRALYADIKAWLPGHILTKADRASMAAGVEVREPLLDHRLVEFAAQLPDRLRVRGKEGKWLMKRAMRRHLPDDILFRPRQDFEPPLADWFRGPLAATARALCSGSILSRTGWFNMSRLETLAEAHVSGRADNSRLLWQLLMLDRSLSGLGVGS
ncbi:MAG: XrtA/PEP-CTERM system amidotransferase [Novosphingobium sp.]